MANNEEVADGRGAQPDPMDTHVGARVRLRRTTLGISQEQLGDSLGLTFQQVQKYERGTNRISASRLFRIAEVLQVPVEYFYENGPGSRQGPSAGMAETQEGLQDDAVINKRETLELMRAYSRITNAASRKVVYDLVKSLAPPDSSS